MTMRKPSNTLLKLPAAVAVAAALLTCLPAGACDYPVYSFAFERWRSQPYVVAYFYSARPDEADSSANALLQRMSDMEESDANIQFVALDADKADEWPESSIEGELLSLAGDGAFPRHVVITPWGAVIFTGRLTEADVRAMVSAATTAGIVERLSADGAPLLVLLRSQDEQANLAAETLLEKFCLETNDDETKVSHRSIDRDDDARRWLVRQLLSIEADLAGLDEPMVFALFGRGRFLPPCVGKGIEAQNLWAMVGFLNGPCSCVVKGGVGADLLTDFDWDASAFGQLFVMGPPPTEQQTDTPTPEPPQPTPVPNNPDSPPLLATWQIWTTGTCALLILLAGAALLLVRRRKQA